MSKLHSAIFWSALIVATTLSGAVVMAADAKHPSCADWVAHRRSGNSQMDEMIAKGIIMFGYQDAAEKGVALEPFPDDNTIRQRVDQYCAANPDAPLTAAVQGKFFVIVGIVH
jgi:hypothetical protein